MDRDGGTVAEAELPPPVLARLVGFGRFVRANGLRVGTGRILSFCRAATVLDPFDPTDLRLAARATLVSRPEDFELLDALFDRYFRDAAASEPDARAEEHSDARPRKPDAAGQEVDEEVELAPMRWAGAGDDEVPEGEAAIRIVASDAEAIRTKDFTELTDEERRAASAAIRRLALSAPVRHSRRYRPATRGRQFDMRRTLKGSLRTQGEPFRRAWRDRRTRPRPMVLLLDVSGSMAPYSRPLIEFAHAAAAAGRRVEAFVFGTRLTRITRLLKTRDPDRALVEVGRAVMDWEGGTRIGDSLKELLDEWSTRSALRGSVVVLCSDGLERGDPETLARQVERLSRLAYRLVWVNPLKGSPRYEPLARGMSAALPYVDTFIPGHNLESLEALAAVVAQP